jgi:tetratricopeptide (TPR) repeat protein
MFESTLEFLRAVKAARESALEYSCHIGAAAAADLDTERGKVHWRRHVRAAYHLGRGLQSAPPDFGKTAILAAELSFERGRLDAAKEEFRSGFSVLGNLSHKLSREVIPHLSRYGAVCLLLGDYGTAADLFEKVSKQSYEVHASLAPQDYTSTNGDESNVWERLTCQSLVYGAAAHGAKGDFDSAEIFLIAARRRGDLALELQSLRPTLERAAHRALLRGDRAAAVRIRKVIRTRTSS